MCAEHGKMNDLRKKNILYSIILVLAVAVVWWFRDRERPSIEGQKIELKGLTMGTTYQVKYFSDGVMNYQEEIDSLLQEINQSLSTYLETSEISRFNSSTLHKYEQPYFYDILRKSQNIYKATSGAFDPTVMQLVNAWGFGPQSHEIPTKPEVDSLLLTVGFDSIFFDELSVCKLRPNTQLDFSAIAKGYAVDVIAAFLADKGHINTFVEIGGEITARGVNQEGKPWAVYIEKPDEGKRSVQAMVSLADIAIATSGNYRNFYEKDGKKYAHTISPYTGYPVQHNLLSVSVFAQECAIADAYATAFMVMGIEKAQEIVKATEGLEAYFIYSDHNGEMQTLATKGIKNEITE